MRRSAACLVCAALAPRQPRAVQRPRTALVPAWSAPRGLAWPPGAAWSGAGGSGGAATARSRAPHCSRAAQQRAPPRAVCGRGAPAAAEALAPARAQIKVYNLQGKNYVFSVMPTYKHILVEACVAVASKTKKNILISIQARHVLLLSAESRADCRSWVRC